MELADIKRQRERMLELIKHVIKFDDEVVVEDLLSITDTAFKLLIEFKTYCVYQGLPIRITSIQSDVISKPRQSQSHAEGRAIDFSVHGWTDAQIERACAYINTEFKTWCGITKSGEVKGLLCHDIGLGKHFHLQARRGLP